MSAFLHFKRIVCTKGAPQRTLNGNCCALRAHLTGPCQPGWPLLSCNQRRAAAERGAQQPHASSKHVRQTPHERAGCALIATGSATVFHERLRVACGSRRQCLWRAWWVGRLSLHRRGVRRKHGTCVVACACLTRLHDSIAGGGILGVCLLPQVIHVIRTRSTQGMSLGGVLGQEPHPSFMRTCGRTQSCSMALPLPLTPSSLPSSISLYPSSGILKS